MPSVPSPFMQRAIALAIENVKSGAGGPFGAVVVKDGRIIAEGVNRVTQTNDPSAHAEVLAIREACRALGTFQLSACELYTSCEPCPMCLGAIYWARPDRVFFGATAQDAAEAGFDDSFIYEELRREPSHRKIPMTPIMREDALAAFRAWRDQLGRIEY
ncbi:MAG: nucleoside deaminase [Candidatus Acidiferrales bacterium]